jgi:hypothetical protein
LFVELDLLEAFGGAGYAGDRAGFHAFETVDYGGLAYIRVADKADCDGSVGTFNLRELFYQLDEMVWAD